VLFKTLQGGGVVRPYGAVVGKPTPLSEAFANAMPRPYIAPAPAPAAEATAAPVAASPAPSAATHATPPPRGSAVGAGTAVANAGRKLLAQGAQA